MPSGSAIDFLDVDFPSGLEDGAVKLLHTEDGNKDVMERSGKREEDGKRKRPWLSIFLSVPLHRLNLVMYVSTPIFTHLLSAHAVRHLHKGGRVN